MTCEQAELRMAELLAGEIAAEGRAALEKHLLDCATCRGDFEFARAGARIEWADVAVPKEVVEATLASFREPAPVVRLLRWATAAAAVFGLAALLIASSRSTPMAEGPEAPVAVARPQLLATMQDAAVGAMVCKDEDGRPVGELGLKSHEVSVEILDGIAKTTVEENFENHTSRRLEGTFNFPLPSDASISRLALEVNGKIEEGTCLERERAREVFEGIVRRMQDPALLEWQPGGFFKCRVFPIEPRSTKRVIVAYTQALPCFQGKMTYVYPLASEKTRTHAPEEVRIAVQARFSGALAKIESPSHHLEVQRRNGNEAAMSFRAAHYRPNNDFVVTMEPGPEEVRVVSHKTDGEDGYFACFATPQGGGERRPGKYAFVLDVSASISAPRLDVAKRLVRAMMERRIDGDRFEILAHHIEVERSGEVDLRAANTFMDRLRPIGGSDVLQALQAAGDAEVVYIGKGAPTFGETETSKILEAMKGRRIRTIAVGSDANGALLERLGGMMRVNPNDDVAKRVAEIAATLGSPVLSDVKIEGGDAVYDVVGVRDLFYGERLIVSGRYRGATAKLAISGRGYRREVDVAFPPKEEGNNYVRRLWAQRRVADLLAQGPAKKPEVTELGVKYQIMTPYTSFLVLETEQMWKDHQLKREVQKQDEVLGKKGKEAPAPPPVKPADPARLATSEEMEKIAKELARGRSEEDQKQVFESQRHFEQARLLNTRGEFDKAKVEAQKAVATWHENIAARKLLNEINQWVIGGRPDIGARSAAETARDDFRVRVEQAQIEITKHVRDGERYRSARMYEQAAKEFENAEFKIQNIPYQVKSMDELLPLVREGKRKSAEAGGQAPTGSPADDQYRLAERSFQAGDFEMAEVATQKALQADPNHAASRALQMENLFILGKGIATPSTNEYDKFMREALVRHPQLNVEIDSARERGRRALDSGNHEQAEREFRKIIEFSKWMPAGTELETRRREAEQLLSSTRRTEASPIAPVPARVAEPKPEESFGDRVRTLLDQGTTLYKAGRHADASVKYEEAFRMKPSSDMVYAYIKRAGEDMVAGMMNDPDRRVQDTGRRLFELAKPGEGFREGKSAMLPPPPAVVVKPFPPAPSVTPPAEPAKPAVPRPVDPTPAPRPEARKPEPKPELKPEPASQERLADPDTTTQSLVIPTRPRDVEDPKARAIREAYEEQLRRDRQELTIKSGNRTVDATIDEFRRQTGWNMKLPDAGGEVAQKFWMTNGEFPSVDRGDAWAHLGWSARSAADWDAYLALPTHGGVVPDIFTITTNVTAPGAPITDALPVNAPGMDFFSPTLKLGQQLLDTENSGKAVRTNDLQRQLDSANTLATKYEADMQVFVRQLELQLAQSQELTTKVDEHRSKLAKSLNEKSLAVTELQHARQQVERLQQDLGQLEEKHIEMARDKKHLEEKLNSIAQAGGNVNVAPKKALEAKVTAIANEIGLVVIAIGKDDGVLEGDEFTIYRGGDYVSKIVIDRSDRKWSAGKVVLKNSDPKVADDVSNHIFFGGPRAGGRDLMACTISAIALDVVTASDDGSSVTLTSKAAAAAPQQIFAVTRAGKFVAMIRVERVTNAQVDARVVQNLSVGRILPGDHAVYVSDPKTYLSLLPMDVRRDLASRASQQAIRAKMGLKE